MRTEDVDVFTDNKAMMYSSDTAKHNATTVIGRLVDYEISLSSNKAESLTKGVPKYVHFYDSFH